MDWLQEFENGSQLGDAPPARLRISSAGFILKKHAEDGKAFQEFMATALARMLLPADMVPFHYVGHAGNILITNPVEGRRFDRTSRDDVLVATRYLGRLHAVVLSNAAKEMLRQHGHCHYERICLSNRLRQEVIHVEKNFGTIAAGKLREAVDKIADHVTGSRDIVLGHGDYQNKNILICPNTAHPVDWVDFGLCYRWYELAHFLATVDPAQHMDALALYRAVTGIDGTGNLVVGRAVDAIIRAGSIARTPASDKAGAVRRLDGHLETLHNAMGEWQEVSRQDNRDS